MPLSDRHLVKLVAETKGKGQPFTSTLNTRLLAFSIGEYERKLMWYTEPDIQHLYFQINGIKDGNYPVPGLIWILDDSQITLYAYREWKGEDTIVHKAPFPNTRPVVCLGSAMESKLQKLLKDCRNIDHMIYHCHYAFWNTAFTELTLSTVTPINTLYPTLYKKKKFPLDELLPCVHHNKPIQLKNLKPW